MSARNSLRMILLFRMSQEEGWRMNVLEIWVHTTVQLYNQVAEWHWAGSSWSYLDPDSSLYKCHNLLNNQGLSLVQTYSEMLNQSSSGGKKKKKKKFSGRNCVWST